jgi:hypothetical protein
MSKHRERASSSIEQRMAEAHRKLLSIGEMERILTERNARREAYRYLLDAHKILSRETFAENQMVYLKQLTIVSVNQVAA